MEMLLTGILASFFSLVIAFLAFAATTPQENRPEVPAQPLKAQETSEFFTKRTPAPTPRLPFIPVEALLLQLESHVRLEQAAAESFIADPNSTLLHSRTVSPFIN
jgi:hypothetical protein